MTHDELVRMAVTWLASRSGAGCELALGDVRSFATSEQPDAIGWLGNTGSRLLCGERADCVLVECKASRTDFRADAGKPWRQVGGMGHWRYYLAPAGIIRADEIPTGWGLLQPVGAGLGIVIGATRQQSCGDKGLLLDVCRRLVTGFPLTDLGFGVVRANGAPKRGEPPSDADRACFAAKACGSDVAVGGGA